jgi:hydroxyethylthiazole kinase-like uncharacterized protein yjeF
VDIPSGLYADRVPEHKEAVVKANYVLSFQTPKLIFFLPETGVFVDQWEVLDIGLDAEFLMNEETDYELIGKNEVLPMYIPRKKFSHKGTYGHALIIGGSYGKVGAMQLASRATLVIGSGLVTAYIPQCGYESLQTALPEAMVITDEEQSISKISFDISPSVIGIGVGMGTAQKTVDAFTEFLKINQLPLVIDADALNILASKKSLLKLLPPKTVLTPHPKELERLIGAWKDDFDKLEKAKLFSERYNCILVVKGAHTITVFNKKGYVNTTGNPGMATAGSGDVLTGVIAGLIAQGYDPLHAAIFGVYLHGKSGDLTIETKAYQALIASDIIDNLGLAYLDLFKVPENQAQGTEESSE